MNGTLFVAILSVRSSYLRNVESPATETDVPDTVQWWLGSGGVWRIKTFALDHDIHTHSAGQSLTLDQARDNTERHYGDVIRRLAEVPIPEVDDESAVVSALEKAGLAPLFELASGRFVFWKPDRDRYYSQSTPALH